MESHNFSAQHKNLLLILLTFSTAMHAMEDSSSSELNSDSEMQVADAEKQSPSFFSKCTKVKLINAGLLSIWLAGGAVIEWAIWTQWEDECTDTYYCTSICDGSQQMVDSFMTDCGTEPICGAGPFEQGPSDVSTYCGPRMGKMLTFAYTGIVTIFLPCFYHVIRRLKCSTN